MVETLLRQLHAESMLMAASLVMLWIHRSWKGRFLQRLLALLATSVHELAHGIAALLIGGDFDRMEVNRDGSGRAWWRGSQTRFRSAFVSSAGYLGTAIAGAALIALRHGPFPHALLLQVFGLALFLSAAFYVRNGFGFATVAALGTGVVAGGLFLPWPLLGLFYCLLGTGLWYHAWRSLLQILGISAHGGIFLGQVETDAHKVARLYGGTHRTWCQVWMVLALAALMGGVWVGRY